MQTEKGEINPYILFQKTEREIKLSRINAGKDPEIARYSAMIRAKLIFTSCSRYCEHDEAVIAQHLCKEEGVHFRTAWELARAMKLDPESLQQFAFVY